MVVKAVCVLNGDAKGTVFFEQQVNDNNDYRSNCRPHRTAQNMFVHMHAYTCVCMDICIYICEGARSSPT